MTLEFDWPIERPREQVRTKLIELTNIRTAEARKTGYENMPPGTRRWVDANADYCAALAWVLGYNSGLQFIEEMLAYQARVNLETSEQ